MGTLVNVSQMFWRVALMRVQRAVRPCGGTAERFGKEFKYNMPVFVKNMRELVFSAGVQLGSVEYTYADYQMCSLQHFPEEQLGGTASLYISMARSVLSCI